MKKVLASAAGIHFGISSIAVFRLLISLTYGAPGKIFPGSPINQMWGLILFDIAAVFWALAFVYKSETTLQYAACGIEVSRHAW